MNFIIHTSPEMIEALDKAAKDYVEYCKNLPKKQRNEQRQLPKTKIKNRQT